MVASALQQYMKIIKTQKQADDIFKAGYVINETMLLFGYLTVTFLPNIGKNGKIVYVDEKFSYWNLFRYFIKPISMPLWQLFYMPMRIIRSIRYKVDDNEI